MTRNQKAAESLAAIVDRLDEVVGPWGFAFEPDEVNSSHNGPYASGHYCRGTTRIGLSCREALDNVYYEHSFVTEYLCSSEIERFTIGHDDLMEALLIRGDEHPDAVVARDGGDRVAAFIHDLTTIAAPVLSKRIKRFKEIMRRGLRVFSTE